MGVIFAIEPKERAAKCLAAVLDHRHLYWWRLNIRVMRPESFYLSPVHGEASDTGFARVDMVVPAALLELPSGEASLTERLHRDCPGWRKHWGKALWTNSAEEPWGKPAEFADVVRK